MLPSSGWKENFLMVDETHRLGRIEQFDERSRNFQIRPLLDAEAITKPRSYTWSCLPRLNQGNLGACVGFSWAHEIAARPVVKPANYQLGIQLYNRAQEIDSWSNTPPVEGTSVIAGVKAAKEAGYYTEYRWCGAGSGRAAEDLVLAVGYRGPVVVGIHWYESMFDPDASGLLHISGNVAGGHAILVNGVLARWSTTILSANRAYLNLDRRKTLLRLHNSWGDWWGLNGEAFISLEDMDRLLHEGGEGCIPTRAA